MNKIYPTQNDFYQCADSDVYQKGGICIKKYKIATLFIEAYYKILEAISERDIEKKFGINSINMTDFYNAHHTIGATELVEFSLIDLQDIRIAGANVELPYIEGPTLKDIFEGSVDRNIQQAISEILAQINQIFEKDKINVSLPEDHPEKNQITGINVKVGQYDEKNKKLNLCITDIATDIRHFVLQNKDLFEIFY